MISTAPDLSTAGRHWSRSWGNGLSAFDVCWPAHPALIQLNVSGVVGDDNQLPAVASAKDLVAQGS